MMENIIMGIESDPREAILHHAEGVDVIPSNKLLSGMDMSLLTIEDREKVLKEYLILLESDYDYILIDCMPSLGMLTINALSAADSVLDTGAATILCGRWIGRAAKSHKRHSQTV